MPSGPKTRYFVETYNDYYSGLGYKAHRVNEHQSFNPNRLNTGCETVWIVQGVNTSEAAITVLLHFLMSGKFVHDCTITPYIGDDTFIQTAYQLRDKRLREWTRENTLTLGGVLS